MHLFIIKLLTLLILASSCLSNKPNVCSITNHLSNATIDAGKRIVRHDTKCNYKFFWCKNLIEDKIYHDVLRTWRSVDFEKGSLGSWTGNAAHYAHKGKDAMKKVLKEIRTYEDGKYIINKNANWHKIKNSINEVYNNITNIKGPLVFLTQNWYIAKHRVRCLKDFIDRYYHHYKCTHDGNLITTYGCKRFTENTIIDTILSHIDSLCSMMPWVLIGKNSRQDKKNLKEYIKSAKAKLSHLKQKITPYTSKKRQTIMKIQKNEKSHIKKWKKLKRDLCNAKIKIKNIMCGKNICTKSIYYVSWDRIEEHITIAYNITDEYINQAKDDNKPQYIP